MTVRSVGGGLPGLATALLCLGCGASPTQPAPAPAPVSIAGLSPAVPIASTTAQTVTVSGANFETGLSVALRLADGSTSTLTAPQVHDVTATAFQMTVTLGAAGAYTLTVANTSGSQSNAYGFTVQAARAARPPTILSLMPSTAVQDTAAQTITVNGSDFVAPLGATVLVPDGTSLTVDPAQVMNLTTTSCQLNLVLTQPGTYQLAVTAAAGSSNTVALTVLPTSHTFTLSGTVRDADASLAPLAGATVMITSGDWLGRAAITDANGHYSMAGLTGEMSVRASKNGYAAQTLNVTSTIDQTLNFSLSRAADLLVDRPGLLAPLANTAARSR